MNQRTCISSASPYEDKFGFCRAIRIGNIIHIAGTAPLDEDGKTVGIGDPKVQARRCFDILGNALNALGADYRDVVRTRMLLSRISDWEVIGAVHGEYFREIRPVSTLVEVSSFINSEWLLEIEAEAIVDRSV